MAALNLGSSPTTKPQSKKDRVLHAAETALNVATEILTLVGDFTENVSYVNAVTGVIKKLIEVKKEVDDNKDRANVLVRTILDVSTHVAQALRDMPEKKGSDVRDALRALSVGGRKSDTPELVVRLALEAYLDRRDFKSMADGIEYKLSKFREAFELNRLISLDVGQSALKAMSQELADKMQSLLDNSIRVKLSDWLKAADVGRNQKAAEDRHHPGTGKWFLEGTPEFQQWKYSPHSLLWLHGISGCGKTMLSSAIIKMLRDNGETITYFYFDTTDDRKQKLGDLLRTLISRLSERAPHAATTLETFWKSHSSGADSPSNRKLLEILQKILEGFTMPVYIVLDALDESSETDVVLNAVTEIKDANIDNVHLFLTSCTEVTHGSGLFSSETAVHLEGSGVAKDINSCDVKNKIRESLVNVADPMFRLVALQLDQLRRCRYKSDIDRALSTMPATMNEIYDRILEKVQSDQPMLAMVKRTLTWLIFSMRPMTLEEVIDALAVDFHESPLRFNREKLLMAPSDLLDACAGVVSRNTKDEITILRLAHASVKEYLTDPKRSLHALQAEISDYAGHYMIARTCIAYLCSFDDYDELKSSPLAVYAAGNWHRHVNRCNPGSLEFHNNGIQLQTPRDHTNDFLALLWQRDSKELIIVLMELLGAGSLQYTYMLRLREIPDQIGSGGGGFRSLRFRRPDDMPPLTFSAHLGVLPAVHQLLEKGADVNAQGGDYGNALQAASSGGHTEIVRALLEKGADVNAQGEYYGNALQAASLGGHTETARALLEKGADVNAQGGYYGNALQAASSGGHNEIVRALLEKGVDVNAQGGYYGNALQAASSGGHTESVRALLEKGTDVNAQGGDFGNALQAASLGEDTEIVRALLEKGADVNAQGGEYGNALQAASSRGHTETARALLEKGADVNAQGGRYGNALQAAASSGGHTETARALLEKGADVNAQGGYYGNALQAAASSGGHTETARALLEKGADVNEIHTHCANPHQLGIIPGYGGDLVYIR
ncbi:hypothetical protein B0H11DRAFT_2222008 [Mycena galericulata]|nr:hypothetical protein B0H11DRAFT_2222008 [Mycena galericulata]